MKSELLYAPSARSDSEDDGRHSPLWDQPTPFGAQRQHRPAAAGKGGSPSRGTQLAMHCTPATWGQPREQHFLDPQSPGCVPLQWASPLRRRRGACCAALAAVLLLLVIWGGSTHLASNRRAAGTGAGAPGTQPQQQQQQCSLQLDGSPWERHCQRLDRVCVDQGMLILHGDRYQQLDNRQAGKLPELKVDTSKIYEYPWLKTSSSSSSSNEDDGAEDEEGSAAEGDDGAVTDAASSLPRRSRRHLLYKVQVSTRTRRIPPLPMRPATREEPAAYLQQPHFSTCTVPVLLYASWRGNFFHVFKDLSAVVFSLLRRTPWREHAKLVSVTPEGLPLAQAEAALLPPLSSLSVQSMADFSSRLPPGYRSELDASQQRASFEGGEQRCFQTLFVCGRNFPMDQGLPAEQEAAASVAQQAAALAEQVPVEPYAYGQAVVQHAQQHQAMQQQQHGVQGVALPDGISLQAAAAAAAGAAPLAAVTPATPQAASRGKLRIMFMKRGSEGRQILNVGELLQRCNTWRYVPPGGGPPVSAECSEVSVPDLETGVAAAREADVFIGMHGANLANGWLMRPGSSVIELMPYQFDTGRGAMVFSTMNAKDATSQVLWWVAMLCDPSASTAGPDEQARTGLKDWWPRDRNSRVPWAVLEAALADVVVAGGSQQQYMQQYYGTGRHRFQFDARGVTGHSAHCPNATG